MAKPNRSSPAGLLSWTSLPPSLNDQLAGVLSEQQLLTFLPCCEAKVSASGDQLASHEPAISHGARPLAGVRTVRRSSRDRRVDPAGRSPSGTTNQRRCGAAGACLAGSSGGWLERSTRSRQQEPARPRPICPPDATDSSRFRHCVAVQLADSVPRQSTADALRGLEDDLGHRVRLRDHREMSALDLRDLGVGAGRHE